VRAFRWCACWCRWPTPRAPALLGQHADLPEDGESAAGEPDDDGKYRRDGLTAARREIFALAARRRREPPQASAQKQGWHVDDQFRAD